MEQLGLSRTVGMQNDTRALEKVRLFQLKLNTVHLMSRSPTLRCIITRMFLSLPAPIVTASEEESTLMSITGRTDGQIML